MFLIRDIKGVAQAYDCTVLATLCSGFEDQLPFLINVESKIDEDSYCKIFIAIKLISEYIVQNITNNYDEDDFKENYKDILFLKDLETETHPNLNLSHVRVLFVGFQNSILKKVKHELYNNDFISLSSCNSVNEALYRVKNEVFDMVVSTYIMEPIDGLSLCTSIKQQYQSKSPQFILIPSDEVDLNNIPSLYKPDHVILKNETFYDCFKKVCLEFQESKINYNGNVKNKILFIDDNEYIMECYKMLCIENDHIIPYYNYGKNVNIDFIEKVAPNIIFCDINMPNVYVLSLMKSIKENNKLNHIPVVFITGNKKMPICSQLQNLGATAILEKSFITPSFFEDLMKIKINI